MNPKINLLSHPSPPAPDDIHILTVRTIPAEAQKERKLKVAAYCRVSTLMETQTESLASQRLHYERLILANPEWQSAGIFIEAGQSGTNMENRPELQKLLSACRKGNIDLVLTKSISRFARNITDCLKMVRLLSDSGVDIWFEKEGIRTDTMGSEFMLSILACLAEEESRNISANIKWGIRARFQAGTYLQSIAPYGYRKEGGSLVVIPEEAIVVRKIYHAALSGKGVSSIARELNSAGIPSPAGGQWGKTTLLRIIRNPVYAGDLLFQKTYVDDRFRQHYNRGEVKRYYYASHHEAIISREMYSRAVENLSQRREEHERRTQSAATVCDNFSSVFSGKIFCSLCGSVMYRASAGRYPVFICSAKYNRLSSCNAPREKEDTIKNAFLTCLNKLKWSLSLSPRNRIPDVYLHLLKEADSSLTAAAVMNLDCCIEKNRKMQSSLLSIGKSDVEKEKLRSLEREADVLQNKKRSLGQVSREFTLASELQRYLSNWRISADVRDFPENDFNSLITRVSVLGQDRITFFFSCGLVLTESVQKGVP